MKQHTDTKSHFSKRHWWVILYCLIARCLYTGTTVDGLDCCTTMLCLECLCGGGSC